MKVTNITGNLKYKSANIDDISFNNIDMSESAAGTAKHRNELNWWYQNTSNTSNATFYGQVNAVEIDWNGAQLSRGGIDRINTTSDLIKAIQGAYSSGGSSSGNTGNSIPAIGNVDRINVEVENDMELGVQGNLILSAAVDGTKNSFMEIGSQAAKIRCQDNLGVRINVYPYNQNSIFTFNDDKLYFGSTKNYSIGLNGSKNGFEITAPTSVNGTLTCTNLNSSAISSNSNGVNISGLNVNIEGTYSGVGITGAGNIGITSTKSNVDITSNALTNITSTGNIGLESKSGGFSVKTIKDIILNSGSNGDFKVYGYQGEISTNGFGIFTNDNIILNARNNKVRMIAGTVQMDAKEVRTSGTFIGKVSQTSDERLKNIVSNVSLDVNDIANTRLVKYSYINGPVDKVFVGTIAQDWENILPEAVDHDNDGNLMMDYSAVNIASSITLAREVRNLKETVKDLSDRVTILENK